MASPTRSALRGRIPTLTAALAALFLASPAFALRVVDYNILGYPGSSGSARATYYRTILSPLDADVIVTEEMAANSNTQFLNEVLNVMEPGQWGTMGLIDGGDTDAALFYRLATVDTIGQWAFYPNQAAKLRLIHVYRIRAKDYVSDAAELRIYAGHLKASTGYEAQRLAECQGIRDSMNAMPEGTHAIVAGDMNFYTQASEPGYTKLIESEANNIGRCYDMLPAGSWHDNASFAPYHTQSTCLSGTCAPGAATGGLDDRFDMILPTYSLVTGQGLSAIAGTMVPVGNDGLHLNKAITDAPTIPEGADYANALKMASDHLPVRVDLQVPARIGKPAYVNFAPVIVGAPTPSQSLWICNPAAVPGDSLRCTFSAPAGFGAPGPFAVAAGACGTVNVTMSTSVPGALSGLLTVNANAPDSLVSYSNLAGTVLAHAQPSLDSLSVVTSGDTLDFGEHEAGSFGSLLAAVHNQGYGSLQARLSVTAAPIVGGDGRFSIQGFTAGTLVSGVAARWNVAFDDGGATVDSTYEATLTFQSTDESLPGAAARPEVQYVLQARVSGGNAAVGPGLPALTRLYKPIPNPLLSSSVLRFDLASPASARLEIFDLSGRRVAVLADRDFTPGRYSLRWDGRNASGASAGAGLYFVRLSGRGLAVQTVRLAIVR